MMSLLYINNGTTKSNKNPDFQVIEKRFWLELARTFCYFTLFFDSKIKQQMSVGRTRSSILYFPRQPVPGRQ